MGMIDKWEDSLQEEQLKLAYLPSPGVVRLRISGVGTTAEVVKSRINKKVRELEELIPELIFGYEKQTLEEVVGILLSEKEATVATAESCTGGYIAHLITRIPGSSTYFKGSVVAYANEVKEKELNVPLEQLEAHGAVSEPVVKAMAEGVREKLGTTFGIATSGIAGPDGGTAEKPVGLVWMAVAGPTGTITTREMFGNNRERNIRKATLFVLNLLRKEILKLS
jgi:nicotinamide-nucleotide amidase